MYIATLYIKCLIHIPYVKSFHKLIVIMLMYSFLLSMSFIISWKTFNMGKCFAFVGHAKVQEMWKNLTGFKYLVGVSLAALSMERRSIEMNSQSNYNRNFNDRPKSMKLS